MSVQVRITLQTATQIGNLPTRAQFRRWVAAALADRRDAAEVSLRIVDEEEGASLNRTWRHKDYPTNVLSFPAHLPAELKSPLLGDLVICAPVVVREAAEQGKSPEAHWAHLVVHGTLHLLGYDHENDMDAAQMEALETAILAGLGYPDPYRER